MYSKSFLDEEHEVVAKMVLAPKPSSCRLYLMQVWKHASKPGSTHTHTENGEQTDDRNVLWCEVCEHTTYPYLLHGTIASMSPHMHGVQPPSF